MIMKLFFGFIRCPEMAAIDIDKVRILVVGDSGVGKSSLVHLLCHGQPITNPSWTIGCTVDVKLHEFREGTSLQKTHFVELCDIGGTSGHQNARSVFYTPAHGNHINQPHIIA